MVLFHRKLTLPIVCLASTKLLILPLQVALPQGESCAAWVAVHAIDFYNDVSTIWAVSKFPELEFFCWCVFSAPLK